MCDNTHITLLFFQRQLPACWTEADWQAKQKAYPWLLLNGHGGLLCSACTHVGSLKVDEDVGVYIRSHWTSTGVSTSGTNKALQLSSLRNKIRTHKKSQSHLRALDIVSTAKDEVLPGHVEKQNADKHETTKKLMRTAYSVAKNNRPYVSYSELCDLQEANGVDLGIGLHSRYSATLMIDCMANEMRSKLCKEIVRRSQKISIMLDESTTVSRKSCLILYIRTA